MAVAPRMAMLILDLISDFQYPDAETVIPVAKRISKVIGPLKSRARAAGVPVIYVNDTRGHWESDQHRFIERCLNASADAAQIVTRLMPEPDDYFLFKPRHSAFFATSLPELLGQLNISTLLLTGLTTHQCVLFTAVDAHDVDWSDRPLVKETDKVSSLDVVKALVEHKANVNVQLTAVSIIKKAAQDNADRTLGIGATPFMRAARSGDVEVMKYLLEHGADAKLATKDGVNALSVAAGIGYTDSNRSTEAQALEAVKLCVSLGLDVNSATDKGETVLHGAARRGANSIIQYLVDNGAKVNAANKQGITPLDIAAGKGAPGGAPGIPKEATMALLKQLGGTAGKEVKEIAKAE